MDTSALVAIMLAEPERDTLRTAMSRAETCAVSAATLVEARLVLHRRSGTAMVERLDAFLASGEFDIIPVDIAQADAAHAAFVRYGKGSGHPAQLNFGDLFAYALAKTRGLPLLFKGDDFAQTDILAAA
ncbi:type II toxin-antitoxin system VapC family toxin [Pelagerythrobacter sp.]|uniref:type II toxin-antitoxin system VapC family toxin n=1 Tax=Pelagerythrobacter sp. TaxID=2800702 RepID=UPI0035B34129